MKMKTVAELIEMKKDNDQKKRKIAGLNHQIRADLVTKANKVLPIINRAERTAMSQRHDALLNHSIYSLKCCNVKLFSAVQVSQEGDLIKFKFVEYHDVERYVRYVKIPLAYFDMTEDEIEAAHLEWSLARLDKIITDKRAELIEEKTAQLSKLAQDIERLKSYDK